MFKIFNTKNKSGFTLVEVLVACVIISTTILALMSATSKSIELSSKALRQVQANMLLEEGAEAVKSVRDNSWTGISGLNVNTNYYLAFSGNVWNLSTSQGSAIDGIFARKVVFASVYRNATDDIAQSGTLDPDIEKVTVTVSWKSPSGASIKDLSFYMANIFK
jgi:prepilin-type N-terminal cleavage/methylation domain-containing protein